MRVVCSTQCSAELCCVVINGDHFTHRDRDLNKPLNFEGNVIRKRAKIVAMEVFFFMHELVSVKIIGLCVTAIASSSTNRP